MGVLIIGSGGGSGGGGRAVFVADEMMFADSAARDAYFLANAAKLKEGLFVVTAGTLQQWRGGVWADMSAVVKGPPGKSVLKLFVQKNGINSPVFPIYFQYVEEIKVSEVVLAGHAVGATFEIDGNVFDETTLTGEVVPVGKDFIITDIEIAAGHDAGSVLIIF